jgi:3-hydroxybutyrate dehydrogenase
MMDVIVKSSEHTAARMDFSGLAAIKPADIAKMVADAQNAFGKVDILVNNAGIQ